MRVSWLVQDTLQMVHFQGGRVDRNSRPPGAEASGPFTAPPFPKKPLAA